MKDVKNQYLQTLLNGEEKGHCQGIRARIDPTIKYRVSHKLALEQQQKEEDLEKIKQQKALKNKEKQD